MKKITLLVLGLYCGWATFAQNQSLEFDGVDDYVSLEQNFDFQATDQFTVEAWIKVDNTGFYQQVISKLDSDFTGWGLQVENDGRLGAYLFADYLVNQRSVDGTFVVADNQWHHVAMSFDGVDTIVLYVDGEIDPISDINNAGATLGSIANAADTHIGNYEGTGSPGEFLNGQIDDLRIWNGVRSDAEILANYNTELSGNESNLMAYYKFDNSGTACDVEDCNPNETHGTRGSTAGDEDLPVFVSDVPAIADVGCGVETVCSLSVADLNLGELQVYPNPTTDQVTVAVNANGNPITYSIYTILGKEIVTGMSLSTSIDFSEYATGLYYLVITDGQHKVVKKVIKQ